MEKEESSKKNEHIRGLEREMMVSDGCTATTTTTTTPLLKVIKGLRLVVNKVSVR